MKHFLSIPAHRDAAPAGRNNDAHGDEGGCHFTSTLAHQCLSHGASKMNITDRRKLAPARSRRCHLSALRLPE